MTLTPLALKWLRPDTLRAPGPSVGEVKHWDLSDSSTIGTSAAINILSAIAQGDTYTTRDGQQAVAKGFSMNITFVMNTSATTSRVRHIIFIDTRCAAATPTINNVFDSAVTCVGAINMDTEPGRYVILYDKITTMSISGDSRVVNHHIELPAIQDLPLQYNTVGGSAATSCVGPHLFQILMSSEATNTVSYVYQTRLLFEDN